MQDKESSINCAIIVSSCDAYSDAWEPFFKLFFKYWPDCPFPVYLISNTEKYADEQVQNIMIEKDEGWAGNLKKALQRIRFEYIIYMQEDYFLQKPVNTRLILNLFELMRQENAVYLRLYPSPGPDKKYKHYKNIGEISQGAPYRTSLQAAFWDAKLLQKLLSANEKGGAFEINHKEKISRPFLSVTKGWFFPYDNSAAIDYFFTGILKGKWNIGVKKLMGKEKLHISLNKRDFEPYDEYIQHTLISLPIIGTIFKQIYRIIIEGLEYVKKRKPS